MFNTQFIFNMFASCFICTMLWGLCHWYSNWRTAMENSIQDWFIKFGTHMLKTAFYSQYYFLASYIQFSKNSFNSKKKMAKNTGVLPLKVLLYLLFPSWLLRPVAETKIGAISNKFCLVLHGAILFHVSFMPF